MFFCVIMYMSYKLLPTVRFWSTLYKRNAMELDTFLAIGLGCRVSTDLTNATLYMVTNNHKSVNS